MTSKPPQRRRRRAPDRGEQFDAWFPRVQRVFVLTAGFGGLVYATVIGDIGLGGTFIGLLLWQGYQEAKRAAE